jgi:acetyltransferase
VAALGAMYRYYTWTQQPEEVVPTFDVDKAAVADLFAKIRADGRNTIGDSEAQAILQAYGITIPQSVGPHCDGPWPPVKRSLPGVMKIASPDILHKSTWRHHRGRQERRRGAQRLRHPHRARQGAKPNATIWGAQIQRWHRGPRGHHRHEP